MKISSIISWASLALVSAKAESFHAQHEPTIPGFPGQHGSATYLLQKRGATISLPVKLEDALSPSFVSIVSLGTPAQKIQVTLDTSNSLLLVPSSNSSLCAHGFQGCLPPGSSNGTSLGSYNANTSSTSISTGEHFNVTALSQGTISGNLVEDKLTLNTTTVNMTIGVTENTAAEYLLGIGYTRNSAYASLPQALFENHQIQSAAYSLWIDEPNGDSGTILFGGVNTAKYTGKLYTLPIPSVNGTYYMPSVLVTNISVRGNSSAPSSVPQSGLSTFMIVNSAAYWTYLPTPLVEQIYQDVGAQWDSVSGAGLLRNCSTALSFNITFSFEGFELSIPLSQLSSLPQNDSNTCTLGLAPSAGDSAILGGSFLRSVYSVFDLSKNEISFAQRNFQSRPDQILEIGGNSTLPGAVSISATATATATVPTKFQIPPDSLTSSDNTTTQTSSISTPTHTSMASSFSMDMNFCSVLLGTLFWLVL